MKKLARFILTICLMLAATLPSQAQDEVEYTKEFGVGLGSNFMLSDVNSKWFGHPNFTGDALMRFVLNRRMAVKTQLGYNRVKGQTKQSGDFYPVDPDVASTERLDHKFSGGVIDLSALYELHFLPYGWARGYQHNSRIVPYVQFGFGFCYGTAGKAFSADVPMGVGVKWKIAPRLNLGLDWTMHLSLCDKLDNLKAPHGIKTEMFRNKDHYSETLLTLTYSFGPKCPTCNKAD